MNFDRGFHRVVVFLSGFSGICVFLFNLDFIFSWDRSGGIIPFPAFFILSMYSVVSSSLVFLLLKTMKFLSLWIAKGFTNE